jgi:hypothetical protein
MGDRFSWVYSFTPSYFASGQDEEQNIHKYREKKYAFLSLYIKTLQFFQFEDQDSGNGKNIQNLI